MSQALIDAGHEALLEELRRRGPVMLRVASFIGTLAFVAMWPVDAYLAAGDDLFWARVVRVAACSTLMTVFFATFVGDWAMRLARPVSIFTALVTGGAVIALTHFTGGGASDYHEALYVTIFGYAMLPVPWRRYDAAVVFLVLLLGYDATLIAGGRYGQMGGFLTHNVLIAAAAGTAIVLRRLVTGVQVADLNRRAELAAANEQLKALDQAKSRFFANISHELRTPLTLTLAPLEAMFDSERDPLTVGQRERLDLAHRNALRLLRLVDDLLALTRAEAASLQLNVAQVDVGEQLTRLKEDISGLAARKQVEFTLEIAPGLTPVVADPQLLDRVLLNVVGNALKFVSEGGKVTLAARPLNDGVEISVQDNGIGIPAADLPRVFSRFFQSDSGSARHFGGTGIGLALSREIVDLHGGRLTAESLVGQGTTMRAWLPLRPPAHRIASDGAAPEAGRGDSGLPEWHQAIRTARSYRYQGIEDATERRVAPRPQPKGHAPTVLVVEDNPDMIRFLVALLAHDFHVLSAQDGAKGLSLAMERRPDLIISDVMMPGMDGFEMARRLREVEGTRQIPLIFLTARGSPEDRLTGHVQGADTYLRKPFRSEELLAAVDALVTRQRTVRDAAASKQDEAVVYMASGVAEALDEVATRLQSLRDASREADGSLSGELAARLDDVQRVRQALVQLAHAGVEPVDVPAETERAVREAVARLGEDARRVEVKVVADARVAIRQEELVDAVHVLLRRALAVTSPGHAVSVHVGRGANDRLMVTVTDEGPSLSPGQAERLFFPFPDDLTGLHSVRDGVAMARVGRTLKARKATLGVETGPGLGTSIVAGLPMVHVPAGAR